MLVKSAFGHSTRSSSTTMTVALSPAHTAKGHNANTATSNVVRMFPPFEMLSLERQRSDTPWRVRQSRPLEDWLFSSVDTNLGDESELFRDLEK
jgi:hypothetical protein